jgi:hypothetical protein
MQASGARGEQPRPILKKCKGVDEKENGWRGRILLTDRLQTSHPNLPATVN